MVQVLTLEDDLDGGTAAETVRFCLDTTSYEIDLSAANAAALRAVLTRYTTRARPRPTRAVTPGGESTPGIGAEVSTATMRRWAARNGHRVSRVGRLPLQVEQAYHQAGQSAPTDCPTHPSLTAHFVPETTSMMEEQ